MQCVFPCVSIGKSKQLSPLLFPKRQLRSPLHGFINFHNESPLGRPFVIWETRLGPHHHWAPEAIAETSNCLRATFFVIETVFALYALESRLSAVKMKVFILKFDSCTAFLRSAFFWKRKNVAECREANAASSVQISNFFIRVAKKCLRMLLE